MDGMRKDVKNLAKVQPSQITLRTCSTSGKPGQEPCSCNAII